MNDSDIEKMFENIDILVSSSLESSILSSSSKALKRSCFLRRTIRRTLSAAAMLLIGMGAFMAGQSHQEHKIGGQIHVNANNQDTITITVSKDFLAWIDAGNFFNQIKMKDKATEAFEKAISLVPEEQLNRVAQDNQTGGQLFYRSTNNDEPRKIVTMAMVNPISN